MAITLPPQAHISFKFDARLTLVHVTAGVETYGPGGTYVVSEWKETFVGAATNEIAKLQ
jgi:hypothetical protein